MGALKVVRERAQSSKDTDLKAHISTLYDSVLSLKEALMLVTDENHELRLGLQNWNPAAQRGPELRQVRAVNYYFDAYRGRYCHRYYDREENNRDTT